MKRGINPVTRRLAAAALLCAAIARAAAAEPVAVAPELWDRPRSARAVLDQAAVRESVRAYIAQPGSRIVIHHGSGQEPLLQAEELRAWLMALAVDGERVSLLNDVKSGESLKIEVIK